MTRPVDGRANATFLYDGQCAFCTSSARVLQRLVPTSASIVPWQQQDLRDLRLSVDQASHAVQWVDGPVHAEGPDAIAALMRSSSRPWAVVGRLLSTGPVRALAWPTYRWVSRHRHQLPGGPAACAANPAAAASPPRLTPGLRPRKRQQTDLQGCVRLLFLVHDEDRAYQVDFPESPRDWLESQQVQAAWVVKPAARVVAHVSVTSVSRPAVDAVRWREVTGREPADLAAVDMLLVSPEMRRQGIGTTMIGIAATEIRRQGRLPVAVVDAASRSAVRLFDSLGWKLLALYPGGDAQHPTQTRYYAAPDTHLRSDAE
ncbi:MAG: GNAT family N-acetyltransferase [Nocardioidaceae bacterium]